MYKGPFWVIYYQEITDEGAVLCTEILAHKVAANINVSETPSHKDGWWYVGGERRAYPWNYYPRGRVEVRRGKAIVFANPLCFYCDNFVEKIRHIFSLPKDFPLVLKADNSLHYTLPEQLIVGPMF